MSNVNSFDFSKYDIGGNGAIAGDNKLTGSEIHLAAKDGWTIWDGFQKGEQAAKTEDAINALFTRERYNNNSLQPYDKRKNVSEDFMKWALGNYNTEGIVGKTTKGNITTIKVKETMPVSPEEGWEKEGISTYVIKDNGDGTTEITHSPHNGDPVKITLFDNRSSKVLAVAYPDHYINYTTDGELQGGLLGDFVKQFWNKIIINPNLKFNE